MSVVSVVGLHGAGDSASQPRDGHSTSRNGSRPAGRDVLTCIELFAGGGGLALGTSLAGFRHVGLIENDEWSCRTLRANWRYFTRNGSEPWLWSNDVELFPLADLGHELSLLAAGAPCQPFSLGGKHKGKDDRRNLFPEVLRFVRYHRPQVVLIENVRGLLRKSFRDYFDYIRAQLAHPSIGIRGQEDWRSHKARIDQNCSRLPEARPEYIVDYRLVNCADYGVPQLRERVFVVAVRADLGVEWNWPAKTHSGEVLLERQRSGAYWRERSLAPRELGNSRASAGKRVSSLCSLLPWATVRDAIGDLPPAVREGAKPPLPNHFFIPGARSYAGHSGSDLDLPSKTLKAGVHGVPGGENTVVLDDGSIRYYTVREAGKIQGFPDGYEFQGSRTNCMRQVGNAVPVDVAAAMADAARRAIEEAQSHASLCPPTPTASIAAL